MHPVTIAEGIPGELLMGILGGAFVAPALHWPRRAGLVLGAALLLGNSAGSAAAATVTPELVHAFLARAGEAPEAGLVRGPDGYFYGTARYGGAYNRGSVFRLAADGSIKILHAFAPSEGAEPVATLLKASDGRYYGTTLRGGTHDRGTIFVVNSSGGFKTLYSFTPDTGLDPVSGLVEATDGRLYGTTLQGGAGAGTVYSISQSGIFAVLHVMQSGEGSNLHGSLALGSDGALYGAARTGGNNDDGTVFRITTTGSFTVLHHFQGTQGGEEPMQRLVRAADGSFYGTTSRGGATGWGSVFRITPAGEFTLLHSFGGGTDTGAMPGPLYLSTDGYLYGTTLYSSSSGSSLSGGPLFFRLSQAGAFEAITHLPWGYETSELLQHDGEFWGTTAYGGTASEGGVFRLSPTGTVVMAYSFSYERGKWPYGSLVRAADGRYYGTAAGGGRYGKGTVFRYDQVEGRVDAIHHFDGSAGSGPQAGLTPMPDGYLYGTTTSDGAHGYGAVIRINTGGKVKALHHFDYFADGYAHSGLTAAADGKLYGVTWSGSPSGQGAVYRVSPQGTFEVVHPFTESGYALADLTVGQDGRLYGTTADSPSGPGSLFAITTSGQFSKLHAFGFDEGAYPTGRVTFDPSGALFGTLAIAGASGAGSIFRWKEGEGLSIVDAFDGSEEGNSPYAGLTRDATGALYGVTFEGGAGSGAVYALNYPGSIQPLHAFSPQVASKPWASLLLAEDGNFYGTATEGGAANAGTLYRFRALPPSPVASVSVSGDDLKVSWAAVADASAYNVYLGVQGGTMALVRAGVTGTGVTIKDQGNAKYRVAVSALAAGVEGLRSAEALAMINRPAAFGFAPVVGAPAGSQQTSQTITVSGLIEPATVTISGGSYSKDGGAYVTGKSTVTNGQHITLRAVASAEPGATITATLKIGGVAGSFSVTTMQAEHGELSFTSAQYSASESAGTVQLAVRRSGGSAGPAQVAVQLADGTARAGEDYLATTAVLTWADGEDGEKGLNLPIIVDQNPEYAESFAASLANPLGATVGSPGSAAVDIIADVPVVNLGPLTQSIPEGGTAVVSVTLDRTSTETITVQLSLAGSAQRGTDYVFNTSNLTLSIAPGNISASRSFRTLRDLVSEGTEEIIVGIASVNRALPGAGPAVIQVMDP